MAVQNLVEQTIIFVSSDNTIDENAILASSLVQSLANNSAGNALVTKLEQYRSWNGTAWNATSWFLSIRCYVSSTFQATIQSNIPNLQAAFPQYRIVTWGDAVAFGN